MTASLSSFESLNMQEFETDLTGKEILTDKTSISATKISRLTQSTYAEITNNSPSTNDHTSSIEEVANLKTQIQTLTQLAREREQRLEQKIDHLHELLTQMFTHQTIQPNAPPKMKRTNISQEQDDKHKQIDNKQTPTRNQTHPMETDF